MGWWQRFIDWLDPDPVPGEWDAPLADDVNEPADAEDGKGSA